jgi:hypothetical protein
VLENCGTRLFSPLLIESWVLVGPLDQFASVYGAFMPGISAARNVSRSIIQSHRHLSQMVSGWILTQSFIQHSLN